MGLGVKKRQTLPRKRCTLQGQAGHKVRVSGGVGQGMVTQPTCVLALFAEAGKQARVHKGRGRQAQAAGK